MLAGLTQEERGKFEIPLKFIKSKASQIFNDHYFVLVKLTLEGYTVQNLRYLQKGDSCQDEAEDAARFLAWKNCLGNL